MKRSILCLVAGSLTMSSSSHAFTVRSADDGSPVRWEPSVVTVMVDPALGEFGGEASAALRDAFGAWTDASDLALPSVQLVEGGVDEVGYRDGEDNWSTVRYAPEGTPLAGKALAITVVTYDDQGRILDADIIVNGGAERPFDLLDQEIDDDDAHGHGHKGKKGPKGAGQAGHHEDDEAHAYDVQNVLTHEAGHFLGLGEEDVDEDATMFVTSAKGETKKRDLSDDDLAGLETLYLDAGVDSMACSTGALRSSEPWVWLVGSVALAGLWTTRRRIRKSVMAAAVLAVGLSALPVVSLDAGAWGEPSTESSAPEGWATVVAAEPVWHSGLIATRLTIEMSSPDASSAAPSLHEVWVWGGTADGLTQVVGHAPAPKVGERIQVARSAGGRGAAFATFSRS